MTEPKKNRTTVEIYNRSYTIMGDEPVSHVKLVASLVDQKMREIQRHNGHLDITRLAVLTAVNTMSDYVKLKEDYAKLVGSITRKKEK